MAEVPRTEMGITEIAERLRVAKSTAHRILRTLESFGFADKLPATHRYRLGLRLLHLGDAVFASLDLVREGRPVLERLVEVCQETVHLGVLDDLAVVYVDKVGSTHAVQITSRVGKQVPSHCTALGKVLLAGNPAALQRVLEQPGGLARRTPNTITDPEDLKAHLARVAQEGYAIDDREHEAEVRCLAVPVRDHAGAVVAAISIAAPSTRMSWARLEQLKAPAIAAGRELSRRLGYQDLRGRHDENRT